MDGVGEARDDGQGDGIARSEGNYTTKREIRTRTHQWGKTNNSQGEEGLETDAERGEASPVGSKEKVAELGRQARTRHQRFKGSPWKDEVGRL